jgi:hypothetical protein
VAAPVAGGGDLVGVEARVRGDAGALVVEVGGDGDGVEGAEVGGVVAILLVGDDLVVFALMGHVVADGFDGAGLRQVRDRLSE